MSVQNEGALVFVFLAFGLFAFCIFMFVRTMKKDNEFNALSQEEKEKKIAEAREKSESSKTGEKIIGVILVIIAIVVMMFIFRGCRAYMREQEQYGEQDRILGGVDWGDDHYYDSNDHVVKEKAW